MFLSFVVNYTSPFITRLPFLHIPLPFCSFLHYFSAAAGHPYVCLSTLTSSTFGKLSELAVPPRQSNLCVLPKGHRANGYDTRVLEGTNQLPSLRKRIIYRTHVHLDNIDEGGPIKSTREVYDQNKSIRSPFTTLLPVNCYAEPKSTSDHRQPMSVNQLDACKSAFGT